MKRALALFVLATAVQAAFGAARWPSDNKTRISWDGSTNSQLTEIYVENGNYIEKNLYYPRIKRLSDESLLLSFENHHFGFDIYTCRSTDEGRSWGNAYCVCHSYDTTYTYKDGREVKDRFVYVNPDFIELQDGRLLMAFQWRSSKGYSDLEATNGQCGLMTCFSDDKGRSWSKPEIVYYGRCWEPAFIQLPSGEIQMYITASHEIVNEISYPFTAILRSFDGGLTWQGKKCCHPEDLEPISRTIDERFAYDGMPSAVLLEDGGIVVPLESWHQDFIVDQTPIVVKTTAEENWKLDKDKILLKGGPDFPQKKEVNKDLQGYGPYSCKLPGGEVAVFCNGTYKGVQGMWALVGDRNADNFYYATSAFPKGYWGSISYIGNNKVIASSTQRYKDNFGAGRGNIGIIVGRLNQAKEIRKAEISRAALSEFDEDNSTCWFLGKTYESRMFVDFGYTADNFQIVSYLFDKHLASFSPENSDAACILFSRLDKGTYKLIINPEGKYDLFEEVRRSWVRIESGNLDDVELAGTVNNDKDTDTGFGAKISIPWAKIGGKPAKNEEIKAHLRIYYKSKSAEKPLSLPEDLEGENSDYPQEWLGITLN